MKTWIALAVLGALTSVACVVGDTEITSDQQEDPGADATGSEAGDVLAFAASTPHPYAAGDARSSIVWSQEITSAGATFIRLHFVGLSLAEGDFVTVSSRDRAQVHTYAGAGPGGDGDVWAFAVDGDTAIVELHAVQGGGFGFEIDAIGHGAIRLDRGAPVADEDALPLVYVCGASYPIGPGDDGREDAACHPELAGVMRPVAWLQYVDGGKLRHCTGWLLPGPNAGTTITPQHCIGSARQVRSIEARFNYQKTTCGGTTDAAYMSYAGGSLLKTNYQVVGATGKNADGGLDYTLFTLKGNPETTWGQLIPTTRAIAVGEQIVIPQHPDGLQKQIGYWEDGAHTALCDVHTVNATYVGSRTGTQLGYVCDTEGGSSGSPVLHAATGRVFALHHVWTNQTTCMNAGVLMRDVCAHAGSLLTCVAD